MGSRLSAAVPRRGKAAGTPAAGAGFRHCVDQGCGGGALFPTLAELGCSVVGVDISRDQLRVAPRRTETAVERLVEADATALPFENESFDAVVAALVSTDIEPWEKLVGEAARVLRRGGRFVSVGTHPCFIGPHSILREEDGRRVIGPGYREWSRQLASPAFRPDGLRAKVGAVHVPLDDLLNALRAAGMELDFIEESRESDPPVFLALRASRT